MVLRGKGLFDEIGMYVCGNVGSGEVEFCQCF